MKTTVLLTIVSIFFLCSCEKEKVTPAPTVFSTWEEIEPASIIQFEGSTFTSLVLNEDYTYELTYRTWTDIRIPGDPCHNQTSYYAKGKFSLSGDNIVFNGCTADPSCTDCITRCDGETDFQETYKFNISGDTLTLNPGMDWSMSRVLVRN